MAGRPQKMRATRAILSRSFGFLDIYGAASIAATTINARLRADSVRGIGSRWNDIQPVQSETKALNAPRARMGVALLAHLGAVAHNKASAMNSSPPTRTKRAYESISVCDKPSVTSTASRRPTSRVIRPMTGTSNIASALPIRSKAPFAKFFIWSPGNKAGQRVAGPESRVKCNGIRENIHPRSGQCSATRLRTFRRSLIPFTMDQQALSLSLLAPPRDRCL